MAALGEIETVFLDVPDAKAAADFWGPLLGIDFEPITEFTLPGGIRCKSAWAPTYGLELIEQFEPRLGLERIRGFSVRVRDIEAAKAEMAKRGIPIVTDSQLTRAREHEVIYNVGGFRFILTQHDDYE